MPCTNQSGREQPALQSAFSGDLVLPLDERWDEARRAWNLAVDQEPAAVLFPAGPHDVLTAVDLARERALQIAVQGTGHGAEARGPLDENTILLNMSRLSSVEIDAESRTVRVEAGTTWQSAIEAAAGHGLAALAGSAPDVGVVGYTLGGGLGWLARKHGLAANSVVAVELVTADGSLVRADEDTEADLFWALRGGGGSFGVVTALEFRLYPVDRLFAGMTLWSSQHAREILNAYADWVDSVPEEMTSLVRLLQVPPIPEAPEPLRGKSFVGVEAAFLGSADEGEALLRPLRSLAPAAVDTFRTMPATGLRELHMDPPNPVPALGHHALLTTMTGATVDAVVEAGGPGSPLVSVEIRHLEGALSRGRGEGGPVSGFDAKFALFAVGIPLTPEIGAAVGESLDRLVEAVAPWATAEAFLNFAERPLDTAKAFDPGASERLAAVRDTSDPERLFRPNHPIGA